MIGHQNKKELHSDTLTQSSQRPIYRASIFFMLVEMGQRTFTVRLRKDEESGYYAARCVELPEAVSQGRTEEEALANAREAIELVLEEYESEARKEGGKLIPVVV